MSFLLFNQNLQNNPGVTTALTFVDPQGNPVPAAQRADFYTGSAIAPNTSPVASIYTNVGGTLTTSTAVLTGTTYTVSFYGTWSSDSSVTFVNTGFPQTITVPNYQSPTFSQPNFASAQATKWVRGAFGTASRVTSGVAYNLGYGLAYALLSLSQQIQQVLQAMRAPTSVGTSLDSWVQDFFGSNLPRLNNELDTAYYARAKSNLSAKKGLRDGLITIGSNYGTTTVAEPWQISLTGACDSPTLACDSTEGCVGNQKPDVSVFITVPSPLSVGVAAQAKLAILGAKPAGVKTTTLQVVGTAATPL